MPVRLSVRSKQKAEIIESEFEEELSRRPEMVSIYLESERCMNSDRVDRRVSCESVGAPDVNTSKTMYHVFRNHDPMAVDFDRIRTLIRCTSAVVLDYSKIQHSAKQTNSCVARPSSHLFMNTFTASDFCRLLSWRHSDEKVPRHHREPVNFLPRLRAIDHLDIKPPE